MAQILRFVGGAVIIYDGLHRLPPAFAISQGLGDMVVGATAPLVAGMVSSGSPAARPVFLAWNIFGIVDMLAAPVIGAWATRTAHLGGILTSPMTQFPLMVIPAFLAPLFLIFHIVCLFNAKRVGSNPQTSLP